MTQKCILYFYYLIWYPPIISGQNYIKVNGTMHFTPNSDMNFTIDAIEFDKMQDKKYI